MAKAITKFDKKNLKALRADIDNALEAVLKKHGLSGSLGNIRFGNNDFRAQLSVATGSNEDAAKREFELNAFKFNMDEDLFGKSFTHHGEKFTICGIKPKSRKYPVLAKNSKGTTYKFTAMTAQGAK